MKSIIFAFVLLIIVVANAKLVMVIRHGEKLNDEVTNLSNKGKARADCLVEIFGPNGIFQTPQKIYAQSPTAKQQSTRPRDTVIPLAKSLGLQVNLSYSSNKFDKLVNDIEKTPEEIILVSWSNDKIDNIAKKFNIKKVPKWDGAVFDHIWVISDGIIPYLKTSGVSVPQVASFTGASGMKMVIVKENIDQCISRRLSGGAVNQNVAVEQNKPIQNIPNSKYPTTSFNNTNTQQNSEYGIPQINQSVQNINNNQNGTDTVNLPAVESSSIIVKSGIITIVGLLLSLYFTLY